MSLLTRVDGFTAMPKRARDSEQELEKTQDQEQHVGYLHLTRHMDNEYEDQFDVDLTILDFLVYKAIGQVFEWLSSDDPYHSDLPAALVSMTADWRTFLKHRHSGRRLDGTAEFRSRLLQFTLVFTYRFHHDETWTSAESLAELQEQNQRRGRYWNERTYQPPAVSDSFDHQGEFPLPTGILYENRDAFATLLQIPTDQRRCVTDIAGTPSLHCLLPLFIQLTAARVNLGNDWLPASEWYDLAGQFTLQAVIEEFLRNGAHGPEPFNTAFSLGHPETIPTSDEPSVASAMRCLFCEEDKPSKQNSEWTSIRSKYINELLPSSSSSSSQSNLEAMQAAEERYSYNAFEQRLLLFLKYLHENLVKPDLAQVEEEQISIEGHDFSALESRDIIRRMRL